ncbi:MAG: polysaccharide biosynthesis protein [Betaproteobacteria bacterium]|nr:polysaccharide biosynthesis protein [Betaproteobacteria bacterium]
MNPRTVLAFAHDVVASGLAWCFAFLLRFNFDIPDGYQALMLRSLVWVIPVQALVFWRFGLYRGLWRYASLPDLKRIVLAVGLGATAAPVTLLLLGVAAEAAVPRSVLIMDPLLLVLIMGGSRLAFRSWKEHSLYSVTHLKGEPVLVLGAGDAAVSLLKDLARSSEWRVVGLLDDDPDKHARFLLDSKVLGAIGELPHWSQQLDVKNAIIAMPSATHGARRRAVALCRDAGIRALTVPSFDDLMGGKVTVSAIRQVELDDLLGRDPVQLDSRGLAEFLSDRVVLVTGAGGSIGSELCRQIGKFKPRTLVLFESSEFALYQIEQEFAREFPGLSIVCTIGDCKNRERAAQVLKQYRPEVVFHSAAYKHVPLMEQRNAWEAVLNNVAGTLVMARAAIDHAVGKFVLISTDKAVNPVNVMGASKRLAEMVCQALQPAPALVAGGGGAGHVIGTRFIMVRFGNVLGSAGSVVPKFREQIARGGPVTVTHPEITRYFMSIPEAAQLVLQAGLMGQGGEIFVLDMGEPVKIVDLARDLIRLSGLREDEIRIEYSGLRPGEKLYEEVLADDERTLPTPHPKLRIAQARRVDAQWLAALEAWLSQPAALDDEQVRRDLLRWVPEYQSDNAVALERRGAP